MLFTILYIIVCILWGIFSVRASIIIFPENKTIKFLILLFILNTILCPISMMTAIENINAHFTKK